MLLLALLLAFSTGIGFLLHLVLPSVELGLCIIIVVLAVSVIAKLLWNLQAPAGDDDEEALPEIPSTERIYLLEPNDFRRRRKKK